MYLSTFNLQERVTKERAKRIPRRNGKLRHVNRKINRNEGKKLKKKNEVKDF
jgi:hypothetical protein